MRLRLEWSVLVGVLGTERVHRGRTQGVPWEVGVEADAVAAQECVC